MAFSGFDGNAYGSSPDGTGTVLPEMRVTRILTILSARSTAPTAVTAISAHLQIFLVFRSRILLGSLERLT